MAAYIHISSPCIHHAKEFHLDCNGKHLPLTRRTFGQNRKALDYIFFTKMSQKHNTATIERGREMGKAKSWTQAVHWGQRRLSQIAHQMHKAVLKLVAYRLSANSLPCTSSRGQTSDRSCVFQLWVRVSERDTVRPWNRKWPDIWSKTRTTVSHFLELISYL